MPARSLELIRGATKLRSTAALITAIIDLIESGALVPGDQLPTVRDLADALGVSRSTVGQAWQTLVARGFLETKRRGGTRVRGRATPARIGRHESHFRTAIPGGRDLASLNIIGQTYPNLAPALAAVATLPQLQSFKTAPMLEELVAAIEPRWPNKPEGFLATHGVADSVDLMLYSIVRPGDTIAVESPAPNKMLDLIEQMGATALPIPYREDGPDLHVLRRALASNPAAFIYQPVGSLPSGRSVTKAWITEAAEIIPPTLPVIEISQVSLLHDSEESLGTLLPKQVTQIRHYGYFLGADIRVGIVGGPRAVLDQMRMRATYLTRSVSRILQGVLAHLLTDPDSQNQIDDLVTEIRRRHTAMTAALTERGFRLDPSRGPMIWLPVPDEHSTCTRLNLAGVLVKPGRFAYAVDQGEQRISFYSTTVKDDFDEIADLIAQACQPVWDFD